MFFLLELLGSMRKRTIITELALAIVDHVLAHLCFLFLLHVLVELLPFSVGVEWLLNLLSGRLTILEMGSII